ncbi:HNH endonuclease [Nocardia australiensis]|uniref:HNH endonuclease n=1 Tax=Nocardia australiensis TaxID=2887191 RepID=UPI001D13B209|nr:HNH endonuclease [Nocardia australiensis]
MTVHPSARNLIRQAWPKPGPRPARTRNAGESRTRKIVDLRSGGLCERCGGSGHSVHHLLNRSQGGRWEPTNCARLCGSGLTGCHGWITTHPDEAWAEGWHLKPWERPGDRPIHSRVHGVVLLADDGTVTPIEGVAP